MFKNVKKEDIVKVLTELGETVNINLKMGVMKQKLLTSKEYLEDAQFVKDFMISTVENRKKEEESHKQEEKILGRRNTNRRTPHRTRARIGIG
ncbi:hypothetical protein AVEN_100399-1 [Araneus ventricosus]|uniref:Uncharacterized protein n=1 Tax=Araneus ventricosus TaxID=182803 RepID=A0A4Y2RKQ3_ARAVE|nr:hypothetical protein AVEN_39573-1 [Araneus ventricosus]GBN76377.1 hypothetical protein AVEN_164335-1 [Araneus ventricosus]GBN82535.1 hypothetical protein AVEN_10371-1 [Araneus ventricosus]GBN82547.1 hypothetical protein AVEN_100399-1 [Araneus ventricosus]